MEQFGAKAKPNEIDRYSKSENWQEGKFVNLIETKMDFHFSDMPKMLVETFSDTKKRSPQKPLEIIPFDQDKWINTNEAKFIWYGHSVALLEQDGYNFLVDPMFGPDAAPIAPFKSKRFSENTLEIIHSLPEIDVVLITHDHYDHLDLESVQRLKHKVGEWYVALGIGRHLEKWGIPKADIKEFDWWETIKYETVEVTFTPSRHFSGRGALDRAKSLWGGWVLRSETFSMYWSGDGGYGSHFKEIGNKLGPFDWAFMECGQYNEKWHAIHMYPEETVQASIDAKAEAVTPVHWGGFSLAMHSWKDPVKRFCNAANKQNLNIYIPRLGEVVDTTTPQLQENWWIPLK